MNGVRWWGWSRLETIRNVCKNGSLNLISRMTKLNFHQKAIVVNSEGKFLTLKKSYAKKTWDLPGGAVEIPEEHEVGLRREIREETGLEVGTGIKPLSVSSGYNHEEGEYFLFIGYVVVALSSEVKISSEHTEFRWVTKEEFLQLDATPYLKDFVAALSLPEAIS
jgi:8-oxo-dGTP diphosphatase